jgi:hypothetical protein
MQKLILGIYIVTTSAALIILKLGSGSGAPLSIVENKLHLNINALTVAGVILYGMSFLTYIYLISTYELGYIIPVAAAFVYVIIFIASYTIFKETFTTFKIAGIVFIIFGLILINLKK